MKVQPPKGPGGCWTNLGAQLHLDIQRYHEVMGHPISVAAAILSPCRHCQRDTALMSVDFSGDWWFFCSACHKTWNLFEHVSAVQGLDPRRTGEWLEQNGIISTGVVEYAGLSAKKKAALDWFENGKRELRKIAAPEDTKRGEWGTSDQNSFIQLKSVVGDQTRWTGSPGSRFYMQMVRNFSGIPAEIRVFKWNSSGGGSMDAKYSIKLSDKFAGGTFVDGILWGATTFVVTQRFLEECDSWPVQRPLMVSSWGNYGFPEKLPPWRKFELICSAKSFEHDVTQNIALLDNPDTKVQINGLSFLLEDVLLKNPLWSTLLAWAVATSNISSRSINRILRRATFYHGGEAEEHEVFIKEMADAYFYSSEANRSFTPFGQFVRRHYQQGQKRLCDRYEKGVSAENNDLPVNASLLNKQLTNFLIHVISRDSQNVSFRFSIKGACKNMCLPVEVFDDTNLLYPELVKTAVHNNMPLPEIYKAPLPRTPSYPKNLIQHAR